MKPNVIFFMVDQMGAKWLEAADGAYRLDDDYYHVSGGILRDPIPYSNLFSASQG